jgi:Ala-tRNA(Pro) deacylase
MEKIYELLDSLNIKTTTKSHPRSDTCEIWQKYYPDLFENSTGCKNIFLKDSNKKKYYLIIAKIETNINLTNLNKKLGLKKLRFAPEEDLEKILNVKPGSVTPFGLYFSFINNIEVNVLIDKNLKNLNNVLFHPLTNEQTTSINMEDFEIFLKFIKNDFQYFNFDE